MNRQDNPKRYYRACREIDKTNARNEKETMRRIKYKDCNYEIYSLKCDLDFLMQQLEYKKESILQEFRNYYEIADDNWKMIRYTAHELHRLHARNKAQLCDNTTKDRNVPKSAVALIKKELALRGMNATRVDFSSVESDSLLYAVKVGVEKGEITINPLLWSQKPQKLQQFMSICAAEELIEELSFLPMVLRSCWGHEISTAKYKDFTGLKKLHEMIKIVVMCRASLRNKGAAFLMKKYAHSLINPYFTSSDYEFISKAEWHCRILDKGLQYQSCKVSLTIDSGNKIGVLEASEDESETSDLQTISPLEGSESEEELAGYVDSID
jgi:hypothetical protein